MSVFRRHHSRAFETEQTTDSTATFATRLKLAYNDDDNEEGDAILKELIVEQAGRAEADLLQNITRQENRQDLRRAVAIVEHVAAHWRHQIRG